jgi:hypothetical protein
MTTSEIHLSAREVVYLANSNFLPQPLARLVSEGVASRKGATLTLTSEVAEEFRAAFTERLAQTGFSAEYELTPEGKMLEGLIDRFLCPKDRMGGSTAR